MFIKSIIDFNSFIDIGSKIIKVVFLTKVIFNIIL
jgi:hypothetical protein